MPTELWLTEDTPESLWPSNLAGLFTEARTADALQALITRCEARNLRIAWLFDSTTYQPPPVPLRPCDRILVECYRERGFSLAQDAQRWWWDCQAALNIPGAVLQFGVCGMGFTQGIWSEQDILDCQPHYADLLNSSLCMVMMSHFAVGRANAIQSLPIVLDQFTAASHGHAPLLPVHPPSSVSTLARYLAAGWL